MNLYAGNIQSSYSTSTYLANFKNVDTLMHKCHFVLHELHFLLL